MSEKKRKTPHGRGLEIRELWNNGEEWGRYDALELARHDAAGAFCAYGALAVFEGEETAEEFSSKLIKLDPHYRG